MAEPTILLADDDVGIRTVVSRALTRQGYSVQATGMASTLWRWMEDGIGDIAILDVILPDENTLDLLPRIKQRRPQLPIIMMRPLTTASPRLTVSDPKPKRGATIDVELSYPTTPWGIRQVDLVLECVEVTVVTVGTSTTFYRRVIVREVLLTEPVLRDLQSPWRGSVTIPTEYPPHTDVSSNTEDSSPAGGTIVWYLATEAEPSWGRMVTDEFRLHVRS